MSYAYIHSSRLRERRNFSFSRFLGGILLLFFLFLVARSAGEAFFKKSTHILSPLGSTLGEKESALSLIEVEQRIKELTGKQPGSWSVYFIDFASSQRFGINEQVIHRAASVNKLYVLASLYYLAGKGDIDLDETITLQRKDIQDFGTGTIRYDPPGTVYSFKTLARLLIEKSDNTAEYIVLSKIGKDRVQTLVNEFGMKQTSIAENKTSLYDIALLLEKMRNSEITNKASTAEMIDFLDQSDFEDRLPALLPKDAHVYHKIGNEVGNIHDVGFITKDDSVYFLGVLTSDIGNTEEDAKKTIAEISKLVFDFQTHAE